MVVIVVVIGLDRCDNCAFFNSQAPINDDDACTGIIGITAATTKTHIVRAILESLAFRMFHVYTLATSDRGVDISQYVAEKVEREWR